MGLLLGISVSLMIIHEKVAQGNSPLDSGSLLRLPGTDILQLCSISLGVLRSDFSFSKCRCRNADENIRISWVETSTWIPQITLNGGRIETFVEFIVIRVGGPERYREEKEHDF